MSIYHGNATAATPAAPPELAAARAALLAQIQRRATAASYAQQAAASRLDHAQQILRIVGAPDRHVAAAIGVVPGTVARWRAGARRPRPASWMRLRALGTVITIATGPLRGLGVRS